MLHSATYWWASCKAALVKDCFALCNTNHIQFSAMILHVCRFEAH